MSVPTTTEHIRSLDLCRGLAALAVLFFHVDFLFFGKQTIVQRGYLCVDFFFLLSGYVIANSYERKLKSGLGVVPFAVLRAARLWPLVALTTLLGALVQLPRWQRELGGIDPLAVAVTVVTNGLTLPSPMSPNEFLFPLNGAAWSIFFEVAANLAYALLLPVLSTRMLMAVVAGSGVVLLIAADAHGTLDIGWSTSHFVYGFPRVAFTFFLGVVIWRVLRTRTPAPALGPWPLIAALLGTLALISVPRAWAAGGSGVLDCFLVMVVFPALLLIALRTRFRSWGNSVAWLAGGISYSVYLLQTPLVIGFSGLPQALLGTKIAQYAPWSGFVFVVLCLVAAYVTWTRFEQPAQQWLRAALLRRREPMVEVPRRSLPK